MSAAHIHLLLTHVPVVGIFFGLLILGYATWRRSRDAIRAGLGVFVLSGLAAAAVYLTGEAAEEVVEHLPGISHALIERHEEAALVALIAAGVLGAVSFVGLWVSRRRELPRWFAAATLVLALAAGGIVGWTANLGGQINHPEIRSSTTQAASDEGGDGGLRRPDAE